MRYTRLRRQIESGALIGTHGTPFSSPADSSSPASSPKTSASNIKRKRGQKFEDENSEDGGDEKEDEDGDKKCQVGRDRKDEKSRVIKLEVKEEDWSDGDASFESESEVDEDSEDEIPLAKLRKRRLDASIPTPIPPRSSPTPSYSTYTTSIAAVQNYDSPRHAPHGFSNGLPGMGFSGRPVYASPYAGWIDGQGNPDMMGRPAPGWDQRPQIRKQEHDLIDGGDGMRGSV